MPRAPSNVATTETRVSFTFRIGRPILHAPADGYGADRRQRRYWDFVPVLALPDKTQRKTAPSPPARYGAAVLKDGGKVNYKVGDRALSGQFRPVGDGMVNGNINTPDGSEGEVQSFAMGAAAVAVVAIVAIVAVVAILANTGGTVHAEADTPLGSASVDVEVE